MVLSLRKPEPTRRTLLSCLLIGALVFAVVETARSLGGVFQPRGAQNVLSILGAALQPDLSPQFLATVAGDMGITLGYAVAGMSLAMLIGLPAGVAASGVLMRKRQYRGLVVGPLRLLLAALRSMHELIWALLFVAALGLTPWAAILAIGVSYAGAIGRVFAERLQDVPNPPLAALGASGSSAVTTLAYGRIPPLLPDMVGYLSYRFECAIRSAAILTFIGLGGVGFRIEIALADIRFDRVWTIVYALVLVIMVVDAGTALLRRRVTV